jgi:ABC-type uncharacterized transport system auxiliary subunit
MNNFISVIVLVCLLSACSSSSKKQAERLYYRFPQAQPVELVDNIIIKRPTALGILGNRPMVAMKEKGALVQMNSNFWLESPKVLLWNYLKQRFIHSNETGKNTAILQSEFRRLEKHKSKTFVSIHFVVTNEQGETTLDKTFEQVLDSPDTSIQSHVDNVHKAIELICNQLIQEL